MGRSSKKASSHFKHRFLRHWRERITTPKSVLVALSGGVDSVVLLDLLRVWQPMLGYQLAVAHVFHGPITGPQGAYRKRTAAFTRRLAESYHLPYHTNVSGPKQKLKSEAALRDFRRAHLSQWADESGSVIATAHTADDLLETRLMRLIRGTGPLGLQALTADDGQWLRPLLFATKSEVRAWSLQKRLKFVNDPSNATDDPLRNWVRNKWLTALDRREPAGRKNMGRSLDSLAEALMVQVERGDVMIGASGLDRRGLARLGLSGRRQALALYLRRCGVSDYTQRHIDEVLKRLDTSQNELKFTLLGREWFISREWVRVL